MPGQSACGALNSAKGRKCLHMRRQNVAPDKDAGYGLICLMGVCGSKVGKQTLDVGAPFTLGVTVPIGAGPPVEPTCLIALGRLTSPAQR